MSDDEPRQTIVTSSGGNGGLYFIVGMLVVAVLVGAYVLIGTPGLHTQVAHAPGTSAGGASTSGPPSSQKVDVTVQQPTPPPAQPERH